MCHVYVSCYIDLSIIRCFPEIFISSNTGACQNLLETSGNQDFRFKEMLGWGASLLFCTINRKIDTALHLNINNNFSVSAKFLGSLSRLSKVRTYFHNITTWLAMVWAVRFMSELYLWRESKIQVNNFGITCVLSKHISIFIYIFYFV